MLDDPVVASPPSGGGWWFLLASTMLGFTALVLIWMAGRATRRAQSLLVE